jgi:hypothetical protein
MAGLFSGDANYGDEFKSRNEAIFKTGGLSGFKDFKNDFFGGKSSSAATPAGDAYAKLTRDMWDSYVTNFMPYENKLIEYANDPSVVTNAMSKASDIVDQSFQAQQASTTRRLKGLGLQLNDQEQAATDRSSSLAKALASTGAQNAVRDETISRQKAILGNPVPTLPQI